MASTESRNSLSAIFATVAFRRSAIETSMIAARSEEHTSELQSRGHLVCRLLLEKKNLFGDYRQLAVETLSLRQQLAVYQRTTTRHNLRTTDRLVCICLPIVCAGFMLALLISSPD